MNTVDQTPRRPALAYNVVDELLPSSYFHQRPPEHGWKFAVTASDGVTTHWLIPDRLSAILNQNLRAHRDVISVVTAPF